jgi:hypothetical protein
VVGLKEAISGEHVYAVGALGDARGEIAVLDGKAYLSYGREGIHTVVHDVPDGEQAMLLVTARVDAWREVAVPADMPDHQLYLFILDQAERSGISTDAPFPFLIEGTMKDILWHVIDGPATEAENESIRRLTDRNADASATLIGFFSASLQGVFTHPGESWHTHVVFGHKGMAGHAGHRAGHVESFSVGTGAVLKLPVR